MDDHLYELLNFDGVLTVLVTTNDGLLVGAAGLGGEDAEMIAATGVSLLATGGEEDLRGSSVQIEGGSLHLVGGEELSLITLTESDIPFDAVQEQMEETLTRVSAAIA